LRSFKDTEFDKISYELLEKIYPTKALNSYYCLGMAETLSAFTTFMDKYINKDGQKFDAETMMNMISEYVKQNQEVAGYYERLQKDVKLRSE
jgi:hypothetical protein